MTRYPRQVDREYLSCRSGGLNKIQMIDGGTLDLHQDLVACDHRRRFIVEHNCPPYSNNLTAFMRALLESSWLTNKQLPVQRKMLNLKRCHRRLRGDISSMVWYRTIEQEHKGHGSSIACNWALSDSSMQSAPRLSGFS